MNSTSRCSRLVRMPMRSLGRVRAGPEVTLMVDAHLVGDDVGQRGLAQARRAVQQHVLHRLVRAAGGRDGDPQLLQQVADADALAQRLRPQGRVELLVLRAGRTRFEMIFSRAIRNRFLRARRKPTVSSL